MGGENGCGFVTGLASDQTSGFVVGSAENWLDEN